MRLHCPDAEFAGIAGPQMIAAGCHAIFPMERLAVMGLVEVLGRYRELRNIRNQITRVFLDNPPDVFIGIDAPDFNIGVETLLRQAGIPTVHYVSPSVWAWREYRLPKIARAVDLMLTLFPFEADYYRRHTIPVEFVGHPLADMIPLQPDRAAARLALNLPAEAPLLAILPGSRVTEVTALGPLFVEAAQLCVQQCSDLHCVAPLATAETRSLFTQIARRYRQEIPLTIVDGQARAVMAAADVVLLASGTATLEAMLLKRPMVVAYRLSRVTYWVAKHLVKTPYVSLPNLLSGKKVVSELIQDAATPAALAHHVLDYLTHPHAAEKLTMGFTELHQQLRGDASARAAQAVLSLLAERGGWSPRRYH